MKCLLHLLDRYGSESGPDTYCECTSIATRPRLVAVSDRMNRSAARDCLEKLDLEGPRALSRNPLLRQSFEQGAHVILLFSRLSVLRRGRKVVLIRIDGVP